MYAVVDIETTGSHAAANGITEIAIHLFDGESVVEIFESLVNPLQPIPPFIQQMTGITNEMVATAPPFSAIATKVHDLLKGQIFVAHNVQFDYTFVKTQLKAEGFDWQSPKLCTVRLSRQILPGYPSYSLGKLCRSLGIQVENRHRAGGDTAATVALFKKLIHEDQHHQIAKSLKRNSKEWILPPNVPKSDFDKLPMRPGVYYFHDKKGKVVYVGKAINIRFRVNSHFSNDAPTLQKQRFMRAVYRISYTECGTSLMASLLESAEIKHRWPRFNAAQKKKEDSFSLFTFTDQHGYIRLALDKTKKNVSSLLQFSHQTEGHAVIRKMAKQHQLCLSLCFLHSQKGACEGVSLQQCKGACQQKESPVTYNARVQLAIEELVKEANFLIVDKGRNPKEKSTILVEKGIFYGMGYIPTTLNEADISTLKMHLTPYRSNRYIQQTIDDFRANFPDKIQLVAPVPFSAH